MTILPKKQKQKIILQVIEKVVEVIPEILKFIVVLKIGTYLGLNSILIGTAITAIVGSKLITINININSKKTN